MHDISNMHDGLATINLYSTMGIPLCISNTNVLRDVRSKNILVNNSCLDHSAIYIYDHLAIVFMNLEAISMIQSGVKSLLCLDKIYKPILKMLFILLLTFPAGISF